MGEHIIEVKDLIKKYKKAEKNAVDGVSFSVQKGEFFAFLGPNGAGKTTTISILTTRLSKTSGTLLVDGLDIQKDSAKIRERIGIIFQNPSLDLNLTGEENIRFHSVLYGLYPFAPTYTMMPEGYKKRLHELASLIGIEEDIFKPVKTFSGGMKRKLEIVRSIMHSPKILFLDEPTVGLDPESRRNLWTYLQNIRKETGVTMFLTTHYLDEAEGADHICIINKGKIVADGTPRDIKSKIADEYILLRTKDPKEHAMLVETLQENGNSVEEIGDDIKVMMGHDIDVQEFIKQIGVKLSYLDVERVSLEDAYIHIIKEEFDT